MLARLLAASAAVATMLGVVLGVVLWFAGTSRDSAGAPPGPGDAIAAAAAFWIVSAELDDDTTASAGPGWITVRRAF